jgi:hypothetical protein
MNAEWQNKWTAYVERREQARRRKAAIHELTSQAFRGHRLAMTDLTDLIRFGPKEERELIALSLRSLAPTLPKGRGRPVVYFDPDVPAGPAEAQFWVAFAVCVAMRDLRRKYALRRLPKCKSDDCEKPDQAMRDKLIEHAIEITEQEQPDLKGKISKPGIVERLKHPGKLLEKGWHMVRENNLPTDELLYLAEHYIFQEG